MNRYSIGGSQPCINLIGGIIEDQSQTVSSSPGGYLAEKLHLMLSASSTNFGGPQVPAR